MRFQSLLRHNHSPLVTFSLSYDATKYRVTNRFQRVRTEHPPPPFQHREPRRRGRE
ncbi:hypothetical protein SK128_022986, partial [Halocaridina rubra]